MRRLLLTTAVVSLGLLVGWSAEAFGAYDPNAIAITTSGCSTPGGSITVDGINFVPNEAVTLTLNGIATLGSTSTNAASTFSVKVTIPSTAAPGSYTIVATGASGDKSSTSITIAANCASSGLAFTPSSGSGLAFTGADIVATASVGAVALGIGGLLILAGRRRRTTQV
jgi:hypothetical protein